MAWRIFFGGRDMGAVNDETKDQLLSSLRRAAQNSDVAEFGTTVGDVTKIGLWTVGAPITFEQFDETATDD